MGGNLRFILTGGAFIEKRVVEKLRAVLNIKVIHSYGMA